jgi:hypothetical protein
MKTCSKKKAQQKPTHFYSKMRIIRKSLLMQFLLLLWLLILPLTVSAQGYYWGSPVSPGYDRTSVVEIKGVVLQADLAPQSGPVTLRIESEGETLTVTLGPEWFVRRLYFDVQTGDKLWIKGSKMKTQEGKLYLTAATVKNLRTEKAFTLRDETGRPLWSSKRRSYREGRP